MEKRNNTKVTILLVLQVIILAALAAVTYLSSKNATVITPSIDGWESRCITYAGDGWNADPGIGPYIM